MEEKRRSEESTVATPPNGARTPARLRLSVSRKSRDSRDSRDSRVLQDFDGEVQDSDDHESVSREELPLTDRRRALFEPLGPSFRGPRDADDDSMLPPPDFETASYPRGWVVGKKRKLVNVDVVESMRRIAVHEMNRKVGRSSFHRRSQGVDSERHYNSENCVFSTNWLLFQFGKLRRKEICVVSNVLIKLRLLQFSEDIRTMHIDLSQRPNSPVG